MRTLHLHTDNHATWAEVYQDGEVVDELAPWPNWVLFTRDHAQEIVEAAAALGCAGINCDPAGPPAYGMATLLTHLTDLLITAKCVPDV